MRLYGAITGFEIFFPFFTKNSVHFVNTYMISQKNGTADGLHSIKMPERPEIEDYIYLGYALLQNRK
jgi:hypothetical protein